MTTTSTAPDLASRVDTAIDDFLSTTYAALDRVIAEATLVEPTVRDPDRAGRVLDRMIETLAGLAIGLAVGTVAAGVRRTFGADARANAEIAIARSAKQIAVPLRAPLYVLDGSPCRSFGSELMQRARRRVFTTMRDARAILRAIGEAVGDDPIEQRAFARMLVVGGEAVIAERFAADVVAGWRCFCALVEGNAVPADALWARFAAEVAGERTATRPTQTALARRGVIAQIH